MNRDTNLANIVKHIVTLEAPHASGGRKPWFKTFTAMKEDDGQSARHHCFIGSFVDGNREVQLEEGALIVGVYPTGSVAKPGNIAKLLRITAEGQVECLAGNLPGALYDWQKDFHSFCAIAKRELTNVNGFKAATEEGGINNPERIGNAIQFSTVKASADSLTLLKDEIEYLLHRLEVANDNLIVEDGDNLGDVLEKALAFGCEDEKRFQLTKEDVRRLSNMGDQLSPRLRNW